MDVAALLSLLSSAFRSESATAIANATSIVGFLLTLYVLVSLRDLRRKFLLKARLPELLQRLSDHGSKLSELMGKGGRGGSANELSIALDLTQQTLHRLREKLPYRKRKTIDVALRRIQQAQRESNFNSCVVEAYTAVLVCHTDVVDFSKDLAWQEQ